MGLRRNATWALGCALLALAGPRCALASGEELRQEAPAVEAPPPADEPLPSAPEAPEAALREEPVVAPEFGGDAKPVRASRRANPRRNPNWPYDPDRNVDYSEIMGTVETSEPGRAVLPPALGFRGYRHNMIAISAGDRTPGYGVLVEYSWNRLGIGAYFSYRNLKDSDYLAFSQNFFGGYAIYRWLPWDFSPYFLLGLEGAQATLEAFGGTAGFGVEARIWYGATLLLGYTYHSTAQKGFFGGALGWSF